MSERALARSGSRATLATSRAHGRGDARSPRRLWLSKRATSSPVAGLTETYDMAAIIVDGAIARRRAAVRRRVRHRDPPRTRSQARGGGRGSDDAAHARGAARAIVSVLTGAGISTASGIPDFRGPEGVWTKDPAAELLSTYEVWVADQEVRRRRVAPTRRRPRPAAAAQRRAPCARRRSSGPGRLDTLVTQNVDGLHADAGTDPTRIVEIHGTSRDAVCLRCGDRGPIEAVLDRVAAGDEVPVCLRRAAATSVCGGILKSATISFGQSLVAADLARAERPRRALRGAARGRLDAVGVAGRRHGPARASTRCGRRRGERRPDGDGRARDRPGRRARSRQSLPRLVDGSRR